jgi:hypothetical protein
MKVSRRNFFAAAAVAPVAAKQAVQQAASVLAYEKGSGLGGGLAGGLLGRDPNIKNWHPANECSPGDWVQEEIESLLSRRSRMISEPLPTHVTSIAASMRIDGLRSVSGPVKARMIAEDRRRRELESELSYIDARVNELKEKLGPLGALFE